MKLVGLGFKMRSDIHVEMKAVGARANLSVPEVYEAAAKEFLEKRGIKLG